MQAVYLSSSPGGARVTRLWEPVGSPCCPRNPSSDATEAADRSTPDPRGGHERGTLRWQRSTAGCPRHKAFKLPSQAAGRGDAHTFASVPWKVRARALLFQDTYASPPRPRQVMNVKAPPAHAESALPPRQVLGRTLQPHTTPVPLQLRMPSLKNSPMASMTCRPQTENQSEEGSGQGLCLREPAEITLEYWTLTKHTPPQSKSAPNTFG